MAHSRMKASTGHQTVARPCQRIYARRCLDFAFRRRRRAYAVSSVTDPNGNPVSNIGSWATFASSNLTSSNGITVPANETDTLKIVSRNPLSKAITALQSRERIVPGIRRRRR
jgi:hypothetical protein